MKLGTFMMPNHPPHRSFAEGHDHDLNYLSFLDHIGFDEAWIGEHYTLPREPCPSPDLLVAQALLVTKSMRISPGGFMLPYHHPAELAHRIVWLDHISRRALLRRRRVERDTNRLGDVRRRRCLRRESAHDGGIRRDHDALLDQRRSLRIQGQVLDRPPPGNGLRRELYLSHHTVHQASSANRHRRAQPEIAHA